MMLVAIPLLFEIVFALVLSQTLSMSVQQFERLKHSKQALVHLHKLIIKGARCLVILADAKAPPPEKLTVVADLQSTLRSERTDQAFAEYPELAELREETEAVFEKLFSFFGTYEKAVRTHSNVLASNSRLLDMAGTAMTLSELAHLNNHVIQLESRLRSIEPQELATLRLRLGVTLGSAVLFNCLFAVLLARLLTSDFITRLAHINENAQRLEAGMPLLPLQEGKDEIAALDRSLHQSFEQLDQSLRREFAIVDNAADVICAIDRRLRFQFAGAACRKLWQFSPEELLGMSLLSLVTSGSAELTRSTFEAILSARSSGRLENDVCCRDGTIKQFAWEIAWSETKQLYSCVARDVTQLRSMERLKQQVLSMVSHDLRAPLTSIGFSLSSLLGERRGVLTVKAKTLVQRAQIEMERLTRLVQDLLELQKLESGNLLLNIECIGINEILVSARDSLAETARAVGVTINGPVGDAAVMADEHWLTFAATRLLTHAIQRSAPQSSINITIESDGKKARIGMTDFGSFIAIERRSEIFEKLRRLEAASDLGAETAVFGLYLVKAIADAHGGKVGIDGDSGQGCTFWFTLPEAED